MVDSMKAAIAPAPFDRASTLGALLHGHRIEEGGSVEAVSDSAGVDPSEIVRLEQGTADLTPDEIAVVIDGYRVPRRHLPENRSRVIVDLTNGTLSVVATDAAVPETASDRTVLSYLELLCAARRLSPATPVPLTTLDLGILRHVLASRRDEVEAHLERLLEGSIDTGDQRANRRLAPIVGLLSAAAACGVLVVIGSASHRGGPSSTPFGGSATTVAAVRPAVTTPALVPVASPVAPVIVAATAPALTSTRPVAEAAQTRDDRSDGIVTGRHVSVNVSDRPGRSPAPRRNTPTARSTNARPAPAPIAPEIGTPLVVVRGDTAAPGQTRPTGVPATDGPGAAG
jgi:hypothetical protein